MERNYEVVKLISSWGSSIDVTEIYAAIRKSLNFPERPDQTKIAPCTIKTDDGLSHLMFTIYFNKDDKADFLHQRDQIKRVYNKIFDTAGITFLRHSEINWNLSRIRIEEPFMTLIKAEEEILNKTAKISVATVISLIQIYHNHKPLIDIDLLNRTLHWVYAGS